MSANGRPAAPPRLDQQAVRRASLAAVLRRVADAGPRSRATLAAETGYNRSTISSLVAELVERGLLQEVDAVEHPGRIGRPGRLVRLDAARVAAVGLELDVDALTVCAVDLGGRTVYARRVRAADAGRRRARTLDRLGRLAAAAIEQVEAVGGVVAGVGLALPGLVDADARRLVVAPNLGWHDVDCGAELERRIGRADLTLQVGNEANLAALAEQRDGAARDLRDIVAVSAAVGIGAGVLVDGRILPGRHGFAGELGHVAVDPRGAACSCGARGCLETVAGKTAVLRAARAVDTEQLLARAQAGERAALRALATAGRALGIALAAAVNLLDPEGIVLGGYLGPLTPFVAEALRAELDVRVLADRHCRCDVRAAALVFDAPSRGAAAIVLERVLADPTVVRPRH